GRGLGSGGILLGGFLVLLAAIIGDVETAALEDQGGAGADFLFHFSAAPFFGPAIVLRADRERLVRHGLKLFKLMSALGADVLVSRHSCHVKYQTGERGQAAFGKAA